MPKYLDPAGTRAAIGCGGTVPVSYTAPTGLSYETVPRSGALQTNLAHTSGTLYLWAIGLPAGLTVGHIAFATYSAGASTSQTNLWFGLYDSSRVQLATTADQLTTVWPNATLKSLAIANTAAGAASTFTTTYSGLHYIGIMCKASTSVNLVAGYSQSNAVTAAAPVLGGASSTGQTTPPAFPFTAGAITQAGSFVYGAVGA